MKVKIKKVRRRPWHLPMQPEFDFDECYITNYPPLELEKYQKDRNYEFYKLQNDLLVEYNKTGKTNINTLWQMFPYIEGVVESLAKKNICTGCNVPDFEGKTFEAAIRVLNYYEKFPYFRAKKLENVAYWKMKEVFLDGNLQLNERATDFDYISNLERESDKNEGGTEENV